MDSEIGKKYEEIFTNKWGINELENIDAMELFNTVLKLHKQKGDDDRLLLLKRVLVNMGDKGKNALNKLDREFKQRGYDLY